MYGNLSAGYQNDDEEPASGRFTSAPVLVGYDATPGAHDALALGRLIASTLRAPLTLACVHPHESQLFHDRSARLRPDAYERLRSAPIDSTDELPVSRRALDAASVSEGLLLLAEELDPSVIVVGSTHRGALGRVVPGGVADQLLHGAHCAVAVPPRGYASSAPPDLRVLALAYDESQESETAAIYAAELAQAGRRTMRAFTVIDPPPPRTPTREFVGLRREHADEAMRDLLARIPREVRPDGHVIAGAPVPVLKHESDKGVDLVCMGSHDWTPMRRALAGSVASAVRDAVGCPVLIVPSGAVSDAALGTSVGAAAAR